MITRISMLIAVAGIAVLFFAMNSNEEILIAIGIGMTLVGVIGMAMGINRKKQTGNRIMFFVLGIIVVVAVIMGLMSEF